LTYRRSLPLLIERFPCSNPKTDIKYTQETAFFQMLCPGYFNCDFTTDRR
jgi:hypothetical protein